MSVELLIIITLKPSKFITINANANAVNAKGITNDMPLSLEFKKFHMIWIYYNSLHFATVPVILILVFFFFLFIQMHF